MPGRNLPALRCPKYNPPLASAQENAPTDRSFYQSSWTTESSSMYRTIGSTCGALAAALLIPFPGAQKVKTTIVYSLHHNWCTPALSD